MINDKIEKLADLLVNYSTRIQKGENVLIEYTGSEPIDLIKCIIQKVYAAGGNPFVKSWSDTIRREILLQANKEQLELQAKHDLAFMKENGCLYRGTRIRQHHGAFRCSFRKDVDVQHRNIRDSRLQGRTYQMGHTALSQ